ncbi:hypothetical protein [Streptomyces sp. Root369]|uniref:hypothetical protein n=1 Tax=Streptomyces sp. Root369 TaxID=1736523 RepID=UPI00130101F5|nr:hypothetical protein [Streptomyces sp. Root369]
MSSPPRPHGQVAPALAQLNDQIRRLMDQPSTTGRAEEYRRLLDLWAKLTREDVEPAA